MSTNSSIRYGAFTTNYTYGNKEREYVFACKGRPFVALVSPHLPNTNSTLIDYDLIKKLGLKLNNVQCRKFCYGGHKTRIMGQVSTTVQCVQAGRITGIFSIKALAVRDLYSLLDTDCIAGAKMKERIANLYKDNGTSDDNPDTSLDDDVPSAAAQTCIPTQTSSSSPLIGTMTSSSAVGVTITSSYAPGVAMNSSSAPGGKMTSSSAPGVTMTSFSSPGDRMTSFSSPGDRMTSSSTPSGQTTTDTDLDSSLEIDTDSEVSTWPLKDSLLAADSTTVTSFYGHYGSRLPILPDRDPGAAHYWSQREELRGHIIKISAKDGKNLMSPTQMTEGSSKSVYGMISLTQLIMRLAMSSWPTSGKQPLIVFAHCAPIPSSMTASTQTLASCSTARNAAEWRTSFT